MFEFFGFGKKEESIKVLLVDDEPKIVQTLQDRLEMNGYDVLVAYDGRQGLESAIKNQPDVIILDILMPVMDGHEMLEELRRHPLCGSVPVIMLSARSQGSDIERARSNGIEDYIVKPFEVRELLEKIEIVVHNSKAAV